MRKLAWFACVLLALAAGAWGQGVKTVTMAFGLTLPPYVIDGGSGMEFDIIQRSLDLAGYRLKPVFVPFARLSVATDDEGVDAAATVTEASGIKNVFLSDAHITYQNVVVTLADGLGKIGSLKDLTGKGVLAFQDAGLYLGPEFASFAKGDKKYAETADQKKQVTMLYVGRVEALVMDVNIFQYFKALSTDQKQPEVISSIFPPVQYKVAFKDKAVRDLFNEALKKLRASGEYDKILKKYGK